ncbi:hypothetical protein T4E_12198 [Trichinella pseudospiralis]|uniref:Uncharacterized protein n=1 Tax=Trichinella pseudospiralis TaxID=6337 RepID=A0A0V0Y677_TRIPS|nr:hypothetical protein T4E_12198 [Trichinella pseudospiralis]
MILELHKKNEMVFNDAKTAIQGSCILCRLIVQFQRYEVELRLAERDEAKRKRKVSVVWTGMGYFEW